MEKQSVIELLKKIEAMIKDCDSDAQKSDKGNSAAGVRLRKKMQEIKSACQEVRDAIQQTKAE